MAPLFSTAAAMRGLGLMAVTGDFFLQFIVIAAVVAAVIAVIVLAVIHVIKKAQRQLREINGDVEPSESECEKSDGNAREKRSNR